MGAAEKMTKADRLAVAAVVAPTLRCVDEKLKAKRVTIYSRETGETLRTTTYAEVLAGLGEEFSIAHAVEDGFRPKVGTCRLCGSAIDIPLRGPVPIACPKRACQKPARRSHIPFGQRRIEWDRIWQIAQARGFGVEWAVHRYEGLTGFVPEANWVVAHSPGGGK